MSSSTVRCWVDYKFNELRIDAHEIELTHDRCLWLKMRNLLKTLKFKMPEKNSGS